jgi:hypothetical protein
MKNVSAAWREGLKRFFAVLTATFILCWPALWNRFPLLFFDSYEYIYTGPGILQKLLGQTVPYGYSSYASNRSEIFSAGLFLVDRGVSLWPFIVLQSLLTAWIIWLVVRSVVQHRPVAAYLVLVASLSVLTSVSWYASDIMPDILGPVLYLCLYLLVFAAKTLRRREYPLVLALSLWCLVAHTTHLLVAVCLSGCFILLWLFKWKSIRCSSRAIVLVPCLILLAVAAQTAVHQRLYAKPAPFGNAPPFVMARLITDGPALLYLQQHCNSLDWTLCTHLSNLSSNEGDFLWRPGGVWQTANPEERENLKREQMPLILATLRTYPRQQIAISLANFAHMLVRMGPSDFDPYPVFTPRNLDINIKDSSQAYERSRQAHRQMPQRFFRLLQLPVIALSASVAVLLLLLGWRSLPTEALAVVDRFLGLAVVVFFTVLANAFIAGVLSGPFPRYQGRVAWLIPLLAGLLAWEIWTARISSEKTLASSPEQ